MIDQVTVRIDGTVRLHISEGDPGEALTLTFPIHTVSTVGFTYPMADKDHITYAIQDHARRAAGMAIERLKRIEFYTAAKKKATEQEDKS